ncbi:MAG: ATP-binding cassette domain-containing protein, partial [Christensenellaceae bacterium]|nr:ATP-binding cassette domain-containing protein [Christensenellaceae bacterium]
LAPYLTLKENIYLPVTLAGKKAADFSSRGDKLVSYLGLESFLNKLPSELSGGEQQRAAIARGLIFSPEIIFLDEPTGNLDSKNAENITQLLRNINVEFNTTVIQVTHNNQLAALSDRVLVMQDGLLL